MKGVRYGVWLPSSNYSDPDARINPPKPVPREITTEALAILAGVNSIAELRQAKGYLPAEVARERNGTTRAIDERKRRDARDAAEGIAPKRKRSRRR